MIHQSALYINFFCNSAWWKHKFLFADPSYLQMGPLRQGWHLLAKKGNRLRVGTLLWPQRSSRLEYSILLNQSIRYSLAILSLSSFNIRNLGPTNSFWWKRLCWFLILHQDSVSICCLTIMHVISILLFFNFLFRLLSMSYGRFRRQSCYVLFPTSKFWISWNFF